MERSHRLSDSIMTRKEATSKLILNKVLTWILYIPFVYTAI